MRVFLSVLISYLAMYASVYTHELGHAYYLHAYGVKKSIFIVDAKPYFLKSSPRPYDEAKEAALAPHKRVVISYAGLLLNIAFAAALSVIYGLMQVNDEFVALAFNLFISINMLEAIVYLVIGSIFPVKDMRVIIEIEPKLRWLNFTLGLVLCVPYIFQMATLPVPVMPYVIGANVLTAVGMGIIRTVYEKRREK